MCLQLDLDVHCLLVLDQIGPLQSHNRLSLFVEQGHEGFLCFMQTRTTKLLCSIRELEIVLKWAGLLTLSSHSHQSHNTRNTH